eukprot:XP_001706355.1 Hypothetical protein GL50803_37588 [Giardia lamblia ATCC 50803]
MGSGRLSSELRNLGPAWRPRRSRPSHPTGGLRRHRGRRWRLPRCLSHDHWLLIEPRRIRLAAHERVLLAIGHH